MADRTTTLATRWKITLTDTTVYAFTDHDTDLVIGEITYLSAVGYVPSAVQTNVELSPDNMDVMGIIDDAGISESDLLAGRFDYARIEVASVDYDDLAAGDQYAMVSGRLGKVIMKDGMFHVELNSLSSQLSQNVGRIISVACDADLGDTRCGYTLTTDNLTVTSVTDKRQFADSSISEDDAYYDFGKVTWVTGDNAGLTMDIKAYLQSGGSFALYEPMPETIQAGDTATVTVGCDKTPAQCKIYGRYDDNRGFPHVPGVQSLAGDRT